MASNGRAAAPVEYLHLSLDDDDVRKNLARGAEAIRRASGQITGRGRAAPVARRTRLKRQMRQAVLSLGRAGVAAREAELERERARRRRRLSLLAFVAIGVAMGASSPARRKALDVVGHGRHDGQTPQGTHVPPPSPVGPTGMPAI